MFKSDDPLLNLTFFVITAMIAITFFILGAIVAVPLAVGFGAWKLYQYTRPIPTYVPEPVVHPPFEITDKHYREHGAIFAPSGHGKTQLLQTLIVNQLAQPDPPAMVIIDSTGAIMQKMERLEIFAGALKDRLVILDPEDLSPPALNFFQMPEQGLTEARRNELFSYLFSAVDRSLTGKQATAIPYLLKLMHAIPGANLHTLREVLEDKDIHPAINGLDPLTQDFFTKQFYDRGEMAATRKQIASRLYTILASPAFDRMFAARENRFNAFDAIQSKKIVLVNTSQKDLGEVGSTVFGRYIIAQCRAAAFARPSNARHLAMLILDEASEYFDHTTERILSQTRQFGLGLLCATQYLHIIPSDVKAAIFGNTAIKIAGPVAHMDAALLAREMYTTTDFIRSMRAFSGGANFAVHVRGLTEKAISINTPFGLMENLPQMTKEQHEELRYNNRLRYGASEAAPAPSMREPQPIPTHPDHDPSKPVDKWV